MMLELDQYVNETIPVKISGNIYNLKSPGVGELSNIFMAIQSKDHVTAIKKSVEMLSNIGMPQDIAAQLNMKQVEAVMKYIGESSSKKD